MPKKIKIAGLIFICASAGICYLKYKHVWFTGEYMLKIVLGFMLTLLLFILSNRTVYANKYTRFLGNISFEIYLIHGIFISNLAKIFPQMNSGVAIFITFAGTIAISTILHRLTSPIIKKIRQ